MDERFKELDESVDQLVELVKRRYEDRGKELSHTEIENVYYSLLGTAQRCGFEAARYEAENTRLLCDKKGIKQRRIVGYA